MTEREPWEPMTLKSAGDVEHVLQVSTGGGKSPGTNQPDFGMEIPNTPPGQE